VTLPNRRRVWTLISLIIVVPAGFASKLLTPRDSWIRDHGAGAMYEIFWILAAFFVWPTERAAKRIALWVLSITCCLEVLQLWHPPFLERIRATFLGATLIGTTFDWWDFPPYFLGSLFGWIWIRAISHKYGTLVK
jgi:hypothetical protein